MSRLPSVPQPLVGEALDSFLDRVSALLGTPLGELLRSMGLSTSIGQTAAVKLPPHALELLARALDLSSDALTAMTLAGSGRSHLPSLVAAAGRQDVMRASAGDWFYSSGSRFCHQCLGDHGYWRLSWRFALVFSCTEHRVLLSHACPRCSAWPRGLAGKRFAAARAEWDWVRSPRLCFASDIPSLRRSGLAAEPCLGDFTSAVTTAVEEEMLEIQRRTDNALAGNDIVIGGRRLAARDAVIALRELTVLARWMREDKPGRSVRTWRTLPRSASDQARDVARLSTVVLAPDLKSAAAALNHVCSRSRVSLDVNFFRDRLGSDRTLGQLYSEALKQRGRPSTRIRRLSQGTLDLYGFGSDDVPQLFWTCMLPPELRHKAGRPSTTLIRAVASLCLVRMVTSGWDHAAEALAFPYRAAKQWRRYVFTALTKEGKHELVVELEAAGTRIRTIPGVAYGSSRALVVKAADLSGAQQPFCPSDLCRGKRLGCGALSMAR